MNICHLLQPSGRILPGSFFCQIARRSSCMHVLFICIPKSIRRAATSARTPRRKSGAVQIEIDDFCLYSMSQNRRSPDQSSPCSFRLPRRYTPTGVPLQPHLAPDTALMSSTHVNNEKKPHQRNTKQRCYERLALTSHL